VASAARKHDLLTTRFTLCFRGKDGDRRPRSGSGVLPSARPRFGMTTAAAATSGEAQT
jgi:hypothetical protein